MSQFALEVPFNSVSFGNVSIGISRELAKRGINPNIFPIGQVDLGSQYPDPNFDQWLNININKAVANHKRSDSALKLWHLNGSLSSVSERQTLITFQELDQLTPEEVNVIKNQKKVLFTSKASVELAKDYGLDNVHYLPLGLDTHNVFNLNKTYFNDGRIVFLLIGKFERRKATEKTIRAWLRKYGNNKRYYLLCNTYNPFFNPEQNQALVNNTLQGNKYFNINFHSWLPHNSQVNDVYNACNIVLGTSCAESFNIPLYNCLALKKHAVVLDGHVHRDYCNNSNSVLFKPSGKESAVDGIFFHPANQSKFNIGNIYSWNDDDFISACEEAVKRFESNSVNVASDLANRTYKEVTDDLLKILE